MYNMYKIIYGRPYNTDTSEFLGSFTEEDSGYGDGYFQYLYQKKNGDFFLLHDSFEACIDFDNCHGDSHKSSYGIIPLDFYEAKKWVEEHLGGKDYEKIFGKVTDDNNIDHICITCSAEINNAVIAYAKANNITKDDAYNILLNKAITNRKNNDMKLD